jgi:hypothetical protein
MEEFFTKVPNYSIEKCKKPFPLLIDFDLKHCIKTETFKNLITGSTKRFSFSNFLRQVDGKNGNYTYN